jgi:hypothetical protein
MVAFLFIFSKVSLISVRAGGGTQINLSQSGSGSDIFSPFDFSQASVIDFSSDQTSGENWILSQTILGEITIIADGNFIVKNKSVDGKHLVVADDVKANIKFSNVNLDFGNYQINASPMLLRQNTKVNLVLEGTNYLNSGVHFHNAAIRLPETSEISIYGTNYNDSVTLISGGRGAALGGNGGMENDGENSGKINIFSGKINLNSANGAAMGGGSGCRTLDDDVIAFSGGDCGIVNIFGGLVSAQSNAFAAAIGGGAGNFVGGEESFKAGDGGYVSIFGGTVFAKSKNAMDIGNGCGGGYTDCGSLVITGGSLKANNIAPPTDGKNNPVSLAIINFAPNLKDVFVKIDGKFVDWHIFQNYVDDENLYLWLPVNMSTDGNYIEYEIKVTIKPSFDSEKDYLYNAKYDGEKFNVTLVSTSDPTNLKTNNPESSPAFDQWWEDKLRVTAEAGVFPENSKLKAESSENSQEIVDFVEKNLDHPEVVESLTTYKFGVYKDEEKLEIPEGKTAKVWFKIDDDMPRDLDKLHARFISEKQNEFFDHDELAKFEHDGKEQDYYVITITHFSLYAIVNTLNLPEKMIYEKGSIVTLEQFIVDLDPKISSANNPIEVAQNDFSNVDFDTVGEYKVEVKIKDHTTGADLSVQTVIIQITDWGQFDQWWGDEIRVKASVGQFPNNSNLTVEHSKDDKNYLKFVEQNIDNPDDIEHFNAYDISVIDAQGQPIQKFDTAEIWIKIPDNWDEDELYSSFVTEGKDEIFKDGKIQKFKHENGKTFQYYVFNTNHFSPYALVDMLTSKDRAINANSGQEIFSSIIICGMMAASFIAIVLFINKKRSKLI